MLNLVFLFLFLFQTAQAGYDNKADGFNLNHFTVTKDLVNSDCSNFNGRIYRGGEPKLDNDAWLKKLKSENIKWVVDLRHEAVGKTEEKRILSENNIKYTLVPLRITHNSEETSSLLIDTVSSVKNTDAKVYVHCKRGEDRTGVFIALLRECSSWKKEFKDYGGVLYPGLKEIMEDNSL